MSFLRDVARHRMRYRNIMNILEELGIIDFSLITISGPLWPVTGIAI
jgi:hypothetical protein